ncbi:MAG TPA: MBL fold metallo-hydrolase [Bacillales bacterium]|nr:MBL fold metallo-hydrolase [Bacillales bacterium]
MKWTQYPLGLVQANAYVVENEENGEAVVIDPGGEGEKLISFIENRSLKPLAILLTHAHFDHIGAVDELRERWDIPVYLHHEEKDWLGDPEKNASASLPGNKVVIKPADEIIEREGSLKIGSFTFEIFETPGHSPGSVSFYNKENRIVFSGDALFAGSIGRTDLYRGDQMQLLESIDKKLLVLPDDITVASGHGPETTIGMEKQSNPFL